MCIRDRSEDLSSIKFAEYGSSMLTDLFSSHRTSPEIRLKVDIEDVSFNMETAIPCGLIINELVSNSLKYAFPDGEGEIIVSLMHYHGNKFCLTISDNGIGIPEDIDFKNTESLGFRLTNNLTQQLEGEISLDRSKGTKFQIIFEELEYETRIGIKETIITAHKSRELRKHAEEIINTRIGDLNDIPNDFKEPVSYTHLDKLIEGEPGECECEPMDAEDPLFLLYTSGSTGKPKGIVHTTGGYMVGVSTTLKNIFDIQPDDTYWCTADILSLIHI